MAAAEAAAMLTFKAFAASLFLVGLSAMVGCGSSVVDTGTESSQGESSSDDSGSGGSAPAHAAADDHYRGLADQVTTLDVAVATDDYAASSFKDAPPVMFHTADAHAVKDAYQRLFALPLLPASTEELCHIAGPDIYELTFRFADGSTVRFNITPTGNCQWAKSQVTDTFVTDEGFWSHLATDLGVDESMVYPPPAAD